MKRFLSWLGKRMANALITAAFFVLAVLGIVYALTFPTTTPPGEIPGGQFMEYFNKILVNTGATSDGTVKKVATTDQIGTLTDGKWCQVVGGKVDCTQNAPTGSSYLNLTTGLPIGVCYAGNHSIAVKKTGGVYYINYDGSSWTAMLNDAAMSRWYLRLPGGTAFYFTVVTYAAPTEFQALLGGSACKAEVLQL